MCGAPNLSPSSSKYPISYIEIRVFSHATEDQDKVVTATRNTLPEKLASEAIFKKIDCTGHYGNPIILLETKLTNKNELPSALEKIASSLSSLDKEQLSQEMKMHLEKHNLYLRFDKQSAFLGNLKLTSNDPIHFKIHFKNRTPDEIIKICKEAGLFP
jgi:RNA binding exosome subunit